MAEAAARLGLSVKATRRAALTGELPAIRVGRRWLMLREPFEALLKGDGVRRRGRSM
jgi:excisionase family DNA binding protein